MNTTGTKKLTIAIIASETNACIINIYKADVRAQPSEHGSHVEVGPWSHAHGKAWPRKNYIAWSFSIIYACSMHVYDPLFCLPKMSQLLQTRTQKKLVWPKLPMHESNHGICVHAWFPCIFICMKSYRMNNQPSSIASTAHSAMPRYLQTSMHMHTSSWFFKLSRNRHSHALVS